MQSQPFNHRGVDCVIVSRQEDDGTWVWIYKFDHMPLNFAAHDERYATEDEAMAAARPLVVRDVDEYLTAHASGTYLEFLQNRRQRKPGPYGD